MTEFSKREVQIGLENLPQSFRDLKFDGGDVMPPDADTMPELERCLWLYRAACIRVAELRLECA